MFSVSRLGRVILASAAMFTCTGCSDEAMVRLDVDGDGIVSRSDLFAAFMLSFCNENDAGGSQEGDTGSGTGGNGMGAGMGSGTGTGVGGTTSGAGSGSPTGTGFSDPLTDGN